MISAVVLAAGAGTRLGGAKQQLLLPHVLKRVRDAQVDEIVVVWGAHRIHAEGVRIAHAPDWERGPGASLRAGLDVVSARTEAALVCLADGPNLSPEAARRVLDAWREGQGDVVAASYRGERGHPVLLARAVWELVPDEGARTLPAILVPCDDLGSPGDVDTADDLERWLSTHPRR
jgi:nicotine blue oxidoreductase